MATSSKFKFKTYNLSTHEIQVLAYVAKREQGSENGARAELSLMANLFERQSAKKTITDYVLKSGWFASSSTGSTTSDSKWTNLVEDVLVRGNRTLPPQINEHDWKGDLLRISTGNLNNDGDYKQLVTEVYQNPARFGGYGGHWTFWCFPEKGSDPFGTTDPDGLKAWLSQYGVKGELYYGSDTILDAAESGSGLIAHVEKLYSSNNYSYIETVKDTTSDFEKNIRKEIGLTIKNIIESRKQPNEPKPLFSILKDTLLNFVEINKSFKAVDNTSDTRVTGSIKTSTLPVIDELVEAPFFEVTINNITFGGYKGKVVPNYVKSLNIKKINNSFNEYNIQLIHQISPGDNPNYIDEILSSVKYDIITIKYGNANTGQIFSDNKALISSVSQHFDFINCNITYNIYATSVGATVAAAKHTFPEYNGKASDKIRDLLWGSKDSDLLKIFPGMANKLEVESKGLIPSNDKNIYLGEQLNTTSLSYLNTLVTSMVSSSTQRGSDINDSIYMFSTSDSTNGSTFKISEVKNVRALIKNVPFMYEVNVGYPDDNFVLNFSVNTNFAWPLIYESSKKIIKYDYDLDLYGNLQKQKIPAYYKNEKDELGNRNLWTSLTRYPVDATLTVRGLTQNSLLLQYIKINNYMFGSKRITSGVYIVTEQQDSIGNGVYSTTLSLLRVTGDEEYIKIDGRKIV